MARCLCLMARNPGKATLQAAGPSMRSTAWRPSAVSRSVKRAPATPCRRGWATLPSQPAASRSLPPPRRNWRSRLRHLPVWRQAALFGLTVRVEDAFGNVVKTNSGAVTLALSTNPGKATLQGNPTVTAKAGVATFSGLSISTPAAGYILQGDSRRSPSRRRLPISRSLRKGRRSWRSRPRAARASPPGAVLASPSPSRTLPARGKCTSYNGPVTLSLASNPGKGTLQGNLTATAKAGVATFTGLSLGTADAGYVLKANIGNVSTTTGHVTVTPAAVAQLAITNEPSANCWRRVRLLA